MSATENMPVSSPRIAPLEPPYPDDIQARFERIMPSGVPPLVLFRTLVRSPRVYQRISEGGLLDKGSISLKDREIMIDRTTARCGSRYEWGVHVAFFQDKAGLTDTQIEATVLGDGDSQAWSGHEALIIELADALHDAADVDDDLWGRLSAEFRDEQLLELIALAGFYHTISFLTNALRLPQESYAAAFPG